MKKSILTLGKVLNKADQKQIKGGLTYPRHYDEYCDNLNETQYDPSCGCSFNSQCANMAVPASDGYGYVLRSGTCSNGICVA
ncbi:hypothetical protein KUL156_61500 [Alteromonas sp. KUL156]|nr:hypothetical protein KUL154_52820 [Alteromonas sp. KUL154]GFE03558.1 hypothetical protein KUL156_61500 [Alteromonas sp. KUL156]